LCASLSSPKGFMDGDSERLTSRLLRYHSVRNNFFMANTEYKLLNAPVPQHTLAHLRDRLVVVG
jgi:hypothetical protein